MDMPETVDEFRELLRYFRDHDMNGNGDPNDEIPMMGSFAFDHDGSDPTYAIMQAFQLTPSNFLWVDEEHNVSCVAITDDFREGLSYLNSMYEEGLIAEDIYALTLNEYRDVVNVTKAGGSGCRRGSCALLDALRHRFHLWRARLRRVHLYAGSEAR